MPLLTCVQQKYLMKQKVWAALELEAYAVALSGGWGPLPIMQVAGILDAQTKAAC